MTQRRGTQEKTYLADFQAAQKNGLSQDPGWAKELRSGAMDRFQALGFPVARKGNEEWKYSDVGPVARTPFQFTNGSVPHDIDPSEIEQAGLGGPGWSQLVFVNGSYASHLSSVGFLPSGVTVGNLADAMKLVPDLVKERLARYADYEDQPFTALNTAFLHHGAFVLIPDGVTVASPIRLLFLAVDQGQETVSHPRVLIVSGKDSRATIIETYGSFTPGRYFTNAVTEIAVGQGARMEYYKVQRQSEEAYHLTSTHVGVGRDSNFSCINIDLGGKFVRNNLSVLTEGEGSSCLLNGLYMVNGTRHVDNQVIVDHAKPYTTSRELYKGILDDKSRTVFHGSIIVREGAVKVDANQVDKNLLLSDEAEADTKPAFWVYCDDVRCGHGAACGQLDEKALFYLRSRGIGEKAARGLLTRAFMSEVIESIENEPLRAQIDALVQEKLHSWLGS